jgi:hypothetical protein
MYNSSFPDPNIHLDLIIERLKNKKPFSFVRFSDGETEILKNRYLEINASHIIFRGQEWKNTFPEFDSKKFDPRYHQNIREDLLKSALYKNLNFYKGIPTSHNGAYKDKDLMLRFNGGFDKNITFSDLFLNSNYTRYRDELVPLFEKYKHIYIIANYRAKPVGILKNAKHIKVPDNFFSSYGEALSAVMKNLEHLEVGALILSSASSLTNIVAYKVFLERRDITFIDIGTSVNDLISMDTMIRGYHKQKSKSWIKRFLYKKYGSYKIKW